MKLLTFAIDMLMSVGFLRADDNDAIIYEFEAWKSASSCLQDVISRAFPEDSQLLYVSTDLQDEAFVVEGNLPHLVYSVDFHDSSITRSYNFVVQVDQHLSFYDLFERFQSSSFWQDRLARRAKYLIILYESREDVGPIFAYLKRMFIVRVVIVRLLAYNEYTVYRNVNICTEPMYVEESNKCQNVTKIAFLPVDQKMRGCSLRVIALPSILSNNYVGHNFGGVVGIGFLMRPLLLLKRVYGLNVSVTTPNVQEQERIVGFHGETTHVDADVIACTPFRNSDTLKRFEFSTTIWTDAPVWFTKKPRLMTNMEVMMNIFKYRILICCVFAFVLAVLVDRLIQHFEPDFSTTKDLASSVMYFVQINCGSCVRKPPKRLAKRCFICSYMLFSFWICVSFQSRLSTVITLPMTVPPIQSVEDLLQSSYTLLMSNRTSFHYKRSRHPLAKEILKRIQLVSQYNRTKNDGELVLKSKGDVAMFSRKLKINFEEYVNLHPIEDDTFVSIDICYALPNGSYFMPYVDNIIFATREMGLISKWINDILHIKKSYTFDEDSALSFDKFYTAFLLLLAGVLCSVVVFIGEILWHKWRKNM